MAACTVKNGTAPNGAIWPHAASVPLSSLAMRLSWRAWLRRERHCRPVDPFPSHAARRGSSQSASQSINRAARRGSSRHCSAAARLSAHHDVTRETLREDREQDGERRPIREGAGRVSGAQGRPTEASGAERTNPPHGRDRSRAKSKRPPNRSRVASGPAAGGHDMDAPRDALFA